MLRENGSRGLPAGAERYDADGVAVLDAEGSNGCALQIANMMRDVVKSEITMFVYCGTLD